MQGKCSVGATSPWPAKVGPRSPLVRTERSPRPGCSATAGEPEGRPGLCTVHIVGPLYAWTMSFTALHRALGVGPGPLARISAQLVGARGLGVFVAECSVSPPGDGGVGGEVGLSEDG